MSDLYDIYFRGDIAPGHQMLEVRQRLQTLFKLDDERAVKLFSGRPLAIRRELSKDSAEQYRQTLLKAGALVELRSSDSGEIVLDPHSSPEPSGDSPRIAPDEKVDTEPQNPPHKPGDKSVEADSEFSLAPVGSDVLRPEERVAIEALEVDTSALDVAPVGTDLLDDEEKRVEEELEIDLSHLSVEPIT